MLTAHLLYVLGDYLMDVLGSLDFIGFFVAQTGEVLRMVTPLGAALAGGAVIGGVFSQFGLLLTDRFSKSTVRIVDFILAGLTGAALFAIFGGRKMDIEAIADGIKLEYDALHQRTSDFLTHPVFNTYQSETKMMRYVTWLQNRDLTPTHAMIPLGSCTMKYNPKTNERQASRPGFARAHPLLPESLSQGVLKLMSELEQCLAEITGMDAATLQPAAGAQGELTGMLLFYAYHQSQGAPRSKIIVPDTAHGTNPASAALCGYRPVPVKSNAQGILPAEAVAEVGRAAAGLMRGTDNARSATWTIKRSPCSTERPGRCPGLWSWRFTWAGR